MDHAITIRDLVWVGGAGLTIAAVIGGAVWFLAQFNTDH